MNISCFGASVTQQKNGYVDFLSNKFNTPINKHGYGGNHLFPCGVSKIVEVLEQNPNVCFIDWFSTGLMHPNDYSKIIKALDTFKYMFSHNNCKLIFLFFPAQRHENRINFYIFLKKYLIENNLHFIDLNNYLTYSKQLISDTVHTTEYGAEKYSEIIYTEFNKIKDKIKIPTNIVKNKYCDIKKININKIFFKNIKLKGKCEILCCEVFVGPNSGYIGIGNDEKRLTWDSYCHYKRKSMKMANILIDGDCTFEILQDEVDRSTCRRSKNDFNKFELDIKIIYYIGEYLEFIDGN
uniref:SGNH/GDSL hydrolase family protein n=1 Tax=viral metagenome TaxID=1070528 RepID=A0A6C0C488_9ZZZZ